MELAGLLNRMTEPPAVVFVTAFEEHAVAAYGLGAVDYVLKPVSRDRVDAALGRVLRVVRQPLVPQRRRPRFESLAAVPAGAEGRTRFVSRDDVRFVETCGDSMTLHTPSGAHLTRLSISRLEEHWEQSGFMRVHRSFLLHLPAVIELRSDIGGGLLAHTDVGDAPVSRRHARPLREHLLEAAARGDLDRGAR